VYPDPATSQQIDRAGVAVALKNLRARYPRHEVIEMPYANPGYDVKVLDADGVLERYVEVKNTAGEQPSFFMTENERAFAEAHSDQYELVVVTSVDVAARSGVVHVHDGGLPSGRVVLAAQQWKGALLPSEGSSSRSGSTPFFIGAWRLSRSSAATESRGPFLGREHDLGQ
jgi:hypothetical protein